MKDGSLAMFIMLLPLMAIAAYIAVSTVKEHKGQFSLRAPFIIMTLVAVLLGLGLYELRNEFLATHG